MTPVREIKCPRCGKPTVYSPANAYRPFCSERCKLIDLGNWAEGKYAVPVEPAQATDLKSSHGEADPETDYDDSDAG